MLKVLALDWFGIPFFSKTKNKSISKIAKKEAHPLRFWLSVGLIAANMLLLMSYVYGVNDNASQGYEIKSLQKRLSVLDEDNRKINLKVSEASSMVAIQSGFLNANFIPAGNPKFLKVPGANQLTQR